MSLAILQRTDGQLTLVTGTEDAAALASKLADMQPFGVQVFAEFQGKALLLPKVQEMLQTHHCSHGWYNLPATHVAQLVCKAFVPSDAHGITEEKQQDPARQAQDIADSAEGELKDNSEEDEAPELQQVDPAWHLLLEPCSREEADKATVIRRTLKKAIGRWQTDSVLSAYMEACLRIGSCGRYISNATTQTKATK